MFAAVALGCGGTRGAVGPPEGAPPEATARGGGASGGERAASPSARTSPPADDGPGAAAELAWGGTATVGDIEVEARPGPVRRRADGRTSATVELAVHCGGGSHTVAWHGDGAVWAEVAACDRAVVFTADAPHRPLRVEVVPLDAVDLDGARARVEARARRAGLTFDGDAGVVEAGVADVEVRRGGTVVLRCRIGTASGREVC